VPSRCWTSCVLRTISPRCAFTVPCVVLDLMKFRIHILHLIFISLHPIQGSQLNEEEAHLDPKALLMQSPRKMIKHSKTSLTLSASAVIAAQQLLMSLVATNSPQYIGIALPCYPETKNEPPMEFPFGESLIFNQAVAIKHSKNCWEILKSSFKARTTHLLTPKAKGKQSSRLRFVEPSYNDNDTGDIQIVSDDSWFILEWLIALFEKDADTTEEQGQRMLFLLSLDQVPLLAFSFRKTFPTSFKAATTSSDRLLCALGRIRATQSNILRVPAVRHAPSTFRHSSSLTCAYLSPFIDCAALIYLCLKQLVELTQTPYLNLPSFASSVLAQLTTITSETLSQFDILFSHLSSAPPALSFKLALCKKIIEDVSDTSSSSNSNRRVSGGRATGGTARPTKTSAKPRARIRTTTAEGPVNAPEGTAADSTALDTGANGSGQNPNAPLSVSPTYVARLPPYSEIVQLLKTTLPFFTFSCPQQQQSDSIHLPNKPWATFLLLTKVKFELLLAYTLVQLHRREMVEQIAPLAGRNKGGVQVTLDPPDAAFVQSVSNGSFAALLHDIFAPQGGNEDEQMVLFKEALSALTGLSLTEESSTKMVLA
jgi:hypothetical protein